MPLLTTNTYSQSTRYSASNEWATWANMNDGNCNTGTATTTWPTPVYVQTDCGSQRFIQSVVIGYDKNDVIPGGWGPYFSVGGGGAGQSKLRGSNDGSAWTDLMVLPSFSAAGSPSNGLASFAVNQSWRFLRIETVSYFALTEFEVYVSAASTNFFAMF